MRYRDLIVVLVMVAVGAWLLASPSPPVTVPNAANRASIPDRPLVPNLFTPQDMAESVLAPGKFLQDWKDLDPDEFFLSLAIRPGKTLGETTFIADYRGPKGFHLAGLVLEDLNGQWRLYPETPPGLAQAPEHWVFQGAQLSTVPNLLTIEPPSKATPLPARLPAGLWRLTAMVEDPRQGEYRIPQYLRLVSPPVEMP